MSAMTYDEGTNTEAGAGDLDEAGEVSASEASALLAELKEKAKRPTPNHRLSHLSSSAITRLPGLFQPRGMNQRHISELVRIIVNNVAVDPVLIIQVGSEIVLIDGHHRLEAYEQAGRTTGIPVRYFEGSLEDAVLKPGGPTLRPNSRWPRGNARITHGGSCSWAATQRRR